MKQFQELVSNIFHKKYIEVDTEGSTRVEQQTETQAKADLSR